MRIGMQAEIKAGMQASMHEVMQVFIHFTGMHTGSMLVLCRWFRFAQLAKGKKSRP